MVVKNRKAAGKSVAKSTAKRNTDSIDIYVRMGEDPTKDYCFNVRTNASVKSLNNIFDTLPVTLSPSYFFHAKPKGFAVSVHPGYMTAEGALLFCDKAHYPQYIKEVPDDALIGDVISEGQLVAPVWEPYKRRQFTVITSLLVWLYLDLPEVISPTPGTAPSNLLFWFFYEFIAPMKPPSEEDVIFRNVWFQLLFFAFHILKVCAFYLILWNGLWHPKSLNPLSSKLRAPVVLPKPESLRELGWTGVKRMPPNDWEEKYHEYRVQRAGGLVQAYHAGELTKPKGYELNDDEGWAVLRHKKLEDVEVEDDLLNSEGKFVVSRSYFVEFAKPLSKTLINESATSDNITLIKDFRSFGYLDGPVVLQELFTDLTPMHKKH